MRTQQRPRSDDSAALVRPSRGPGRATDLLVLVVFLAVLAAIAVFEGVVARTAASDWFNTSAQVVWTPPVPLSHAVWAAVFLLLALAGWRIWRARPVASRRWSRPLYVIMVVLLAAWPPVYLDGYPLIGTTALWIGFTLAFLLVVALVVLIPGAWGSTRGGAVLLVPAAIWILYVATVNLGDAVLASLE